MARKKNQKSGKGSPSNKSNPGKGQQVSKGLGTGSAKQSSPNSQAISLGTKFAIRNNGSDGDITITGSEIIGVASNASNGRMLFIADLNPITWASSRVARMMPLFEMYRIESLKVTYIPSCSTSAAGLLYMYYDRDPNDPPISNVNNPTNLARLMSSQGAVAGQVWKPLTLSYRPSGGDLKAYFSAPTMDNGDLRLTSQGLVYAYTSASPNVVGGGIFKFDYVMRLLTPTGAPVNRTTLSPWSYSDGTIVLGSTPTTSAWIPQGGYLPIGNTPGATSFSESIYEIILDTDTSVSLATDPLVRPLAAYTPLYIRYSTTGWKAYFSLGSAIACLTTDYLTGGAVAGAVCSAWSRLIMDVGTNLLAAS